MQFSQSNSPLSFLSSQKQPNPRYHKNRYHSIRELAVKLSSKAESSPDKKRCSCPKCLNPRFGSIYSDMLWSFMAIMEWISCRLGWFIGNLIFLICSEEICYIWIQGLVDWAEVWMIRHRKKYSMRWRLCRVQNFIACMPVCMLRFILIFRYLPLEIVCLCTIYCQVSL